MSKSPSRKKYGSSYDSNEQFFDEFTGLGYVHSFHLLTIEHLLQVTIFETRVRRSVSVHDWQKN